MCGRLVQKRKLEDLVRQFRVTRVSEIVKFWELHYNLSPTQNALVIRAIPEEESDHEARLGIDSP